MAPRPRLLLGWQPLHSGCSLSSFPLPDPAPPLPPSPPHSRASLRSCGHQATLAQRRNWRIRQAAGGPDGADWRHERGRVERGVTEENDWHDNRERAEAERLRRWRNGFGQESGSREEPADWLDVSPGAGTRMPRRGKGRMDGVGIADLGLLRGF